MSLLAAYLRRQYKLLLLLAGFFVIFAAVFFLYSLPAEALIYTGALCLVLGLVLFALLPCHSAGAAAGASPPRRTHLRI